MSGSKQHFIPQSLLKGFGFTKGKSTFVVAYTYDRGIFTPATDGIAAERHFYSELGVSGEDETLDDRITAYESPLANALFELRSLDDGQQADPNQASEFVTHLSVRNDSFRKSATSAGTAMIGGLADQFADPETARMLLGVDSDNPESPMAKELAETYSRYPALFAHLGIDEAQFQQWAIGLVRDSFDSLHAETQGPMTEATEMILSRFPGMAADAQRSSLSKTLAPEQRVERMATFSWRVVHAEGLILPDCVAVAVDSEGVASPLLFADLDALQSIFMPLASDRLLVGSRANEEPITADINEAFAGCSWDFFVARDRTAELEALRGTLRTRIATHLTEVVGNALDESINEHKPKS